MSPGAGPTTPLQDFFCQILDPPLTEKLDPPLIMLQFSFFNVPVHVGTIVLNIKYFIFLTH